MKYLLVPFLLFAMPLPAIAESFNQLPANYMIWRGKVINLDYMAGKGIVPTVQPQPQTQPLTISREVSANQQRVEFENAKAQILIERLRNMR